MSSIDRLPDARHIRRLARQLEKRRAGAGPALYTTAMRDENNAAEFDGLRSYFYTDAGVVKAVDGVSFDVPKNSVVALVGESGCGKSVTALSLMQLLPRPYGQTAGGQLRLNMGGGRAYNIVCTPDSVMTGVRGSRVSMIFQEPMTSLNPVLRVGPQVDEALLFHNSGMSAAEARCRTAGTLRLVGFSDAETVCGMYPHQLSGGMRQRVMTAMALACGPELLIADEPTTALDVTIQAQILELLKELKSKLGCAILLITHDLGVVAEMADYVVVMYAGRVVEQGACRELFQDPRHPYTVGLMRSHPVRGSRERELYSIPGAVPAPLDLPAGCYFQPRCGCAAAECALAYPPTVRISDTHSVACLHCGGSFPGREGK